MKNKTKKVTRLDIMMDILGSGHSIDVDYIKEQFEVNGLANLIYKIPMYITDIKKKGGIIKVEKSGVRVTAYQLMNASSFRGV